MQTHDVAVEHGPASQCELILGYLMTGKSLSTLAALDLFGCFRLGARIWDLKARGYDIETTWLETVSGKRIAEYRLIGRTTPGGYQAFVPPSEKGIAQ